MKKAFTLVELVVVITVLGILSTIGFVSYVGYAQDSRDGVRLANLHDIKKGLELKKSQSGDFPIPDNAYSVEYLGKEIWKQGVLGKKTKKHIKFNAVNMDPKYDTDYSYSVSSDGKRFEVGTVLEDESNTPLSYLFGNTYASGEDKALNFGNLKGKFHVAKVNGETHVFSIPSMMFRDSSNLDVVIDQPTTQFSVTGEGALPESYIGKSEANDVITFTPRLLYSGPNCGVETDQDIVNFISNLRDSFNYEPFLSNPNYQEIFEDYNTLRSHMEDFDTLKKLGFKINKLLDCDIKNFKTVDVFPVQCGYEQLDFEKVENGFDLIEDESCLFEYSVSRPYGGSGNGGAIVKDGEGFNGSSGLHISFDGSYQTGYFKYQVFHYKHAKFEYNIKTSEIQPGSYIDFYINGFKYYTLSPGDDYHLGFQKVTTDLLKPGLYDFEWKIHSQYYDYTEMWLDDLNFTCVGGGPLCGFTGGFEPGNDDISFDGYVPMPWRKVSDATEGSVALLNPRMAANSNATITFNKTLNIPGRLSIDLKMIDTATGQTKIFINGVEFKYWSNRLSQGDDIETEYQTYITPLLPEGDYEIKVQVHRTNHYTRDAYLYVDNFRIYCSLGDVNCGNDMSFESSDTPFQGYFTYDGASTIHWPLEQKSVDPDFVSHGEFSIRSPNIPHGTTTEMYYHKDFDQPAKINFDYMFRGQYSWAKVFINDVEYKRFSYDDEFSTYTTPLLSGKHTIKIQVYRGTSTGNWGAYAYLYLDNFRLSCLDGVNNSEGEVCGFDYNFEDSNNEPDDIFVFSGTIKSPWLLTKEDGQFKNGLQGMITPRLVGGDLAYMTFKKIVSENEELKFDIRGGSSRGGRYVNFYVDGDLKKHWNDKGYSKLTSTFQEYTTGPLTAGEHTFQLEISNDSTKWPSWANIDNIRVE